MSNDTEILTLTDFLLARIEEDEEWARWGRLSDDPSDPDSATKILHWDHARLRAECEAKRQIVEGLRRAETHVAEVGGRHEALYGIRSAARSLAAVYVDHPDFREEWRP